MRGSRALATVVAALLLAAGLGACGDGGSDERGSATGAGATTPATPGADQQPPSSSNDEQSGGSGSGGQEPARGGEASIEDFGSEAGGADRGAILAAFENYMNAIASRDYATACSHLSATVQHSLEQFLAQGRKGAGCAATLPQLLAPSAASIAREQANGEIARVRVEGDRAFVVFRAPGAKLYQLTMVREGGEWKAATVVASVLVPDL